MRLLRLSTLSNSLIGKLATYATYSSSSGLTTADNTDYVISGTTLYVNGGSVSNVSGFDTTDSLSLSEGVLTITDNNSDFAVTIGTTKLSGNVTSINLANTKYVLNNSNVVELMWTKSENNYTTSCCFFKCFINIL